MKTKGTNSLFMPEGLNYSRGWETENSEYPNIEKEIKTNGFYFSKTEKFLILETYK